MAYLDKHSTLAPVMVNVVSSNPTGGNFLKFFKPLDVNSGLKCKCDLIVKNSNARYKTALKPHLIPAHQIAAEGLERTASRPRVE